MNEIVSRDNQWVKMACSLKQKKGRHGGMVLPIPPGSDIMEQAKIFSGFEWFRFLRSY